MENGVAVLFFVLLMLAPIYLIQFEYDLYTATHGEARSGAAGAGLALAIVFRTVSRTVLRTIIRTSARAGMRATMKGAMRTAARTAVRGGSAGIAKRMASPQRTESIRKDNLKSMMFASVLLYASWAIVIGLGQPYSGLMNKADTIAYEAQLAKAEAEDLAGLDELGEGSFRAQQLVKALEREYRSQRRELKMSRDASERAVIEEEMRRIELEMSAAQVRLNQALRASGNYIFNPTKSDSESFSEPPDWLNSFNGYLTTYAPYPGQTATGSALIWLGGVVMVLPLWLMFFVQAAASKQAGLTLRHETGPDGGIIQLYFAGAFSFMPLTSDVVVEHATTAQRGRIAMLGVVAPLVAAALFWLGWKSTGNPILVFVSDAFLIYPMVQIFPLTPLEGIFIWRWSRLLWLVLFVFIMFSFMIPGSEALRSVI
jgi:hypothetical protein